MTTVLRAYKTELDPTCKQVEQLHSARGMCKVGLQLGTEKEDRGLQGTGKSPSAIDLHRELNVLKRIPVEEDGVPWMYESSKCAPQEKLRDLD